MLEVDRLVFAERLRALMREGFDFGTLRALERYRERRDREEEGSS